MLKKLMITTFIISLLPLLSAKEPFLDGLKQFESKSNKDIIQHVKDVSCDNAADADKEACVNRLNFDTSAFAAFYSGDQELALFLLENDFSLKAVRMGSERFFSILAGITPYRPQYAGTFNALLAKTQNFSDEDLKELITGQNAQTKTNVVHLIAFFTPKNKNMQSINTAEANRQPSFQKMTLKYLVSDEYKKKLFCEALAARDGNGNTPFHIALKYNNKESFYNLAEAGKAAGCDGKAVIAALIQKNNEKMSVIDARDSFYTDVVTRFFGGIPQYTDAQWKNKQNIDAERAKQLSGQINKAAAAAYVPTTAMAVKKISISPVKVDMPRLTRQNVPEKMPVESPKAQIAQRQVNKTAPAAKAVNKTPQPAAKAKTPAAAPAKASVANADKNSTDSLAAARPAAADTAVWHPQSAPNNGLVFPADSAYVSYVHKVDFSPADSVVNAEEKPRTAVSEAVEARSRRGHFKDEAKTEALAEFAETVQKTLGVPIKITSAYRCKASNARAGGSSKSQHMTCEAIDLVPEGGMTLKQAYNKLSESGLSYGQLILEQHGHKTCVHVSIGTKKEDRKLTSNGSYALVRAHK